MHLLSAALGWLHWDGILGLLNTNIINTLALDSLQRCHWQLGLSFGITYPFHQPGVCSVPCYRDWPRKFPARPWSRIAYWIAVSLACAGEDFLLRRGWQMHYPFLGGISCNWSVTSLNGQFIPVKIIVINRLKCLVAVAGSHRLSSANLVRRRRR